MVFSHICLLLFFISVAFRMESGVQRFYGKGPHPLLWMLVHGTHVEK